MFESTMNMLLFESETWIEEFVAYKFTGGNGINKTFLQFMDRPFMLLIGWLWCFMSWVLDGVFERRTRCMGTNLDFNLWNQFPLDHYKRCNFFFCIILEKFIFLGDHQFINVIPHNPSLWILSLTAIQVC